MTAVKLFFMHVPKTAGTSFRRFLERSMREHGQEVSSRRRDGIWSADSESYPTYDEFVGTLRAEAPGFDLICGHYPYHVLELLPPGTGVVTVLRDPLARCISHVKHQMAYERVSRPEGPERDVNAFLAAPRNGMFLQTIANLAVKYLSSSAHPDALVAPHALSVERAVERCCRAHFGFADELPAFQRRLAEALFDGRCASLRLPHENRSEDRFEVADLAPRNRDLLRELNELDLALDELMRGVLWARESDRERADVREPDRREKTGVAWDPPGGQSSP